jgi:DNA-binding NarL/FixJ family response regulator
MSGSATCFLCTHAALPKSKGGKAPDILLLDWAASLSLRDVLGIQARLPGCRVVLWTRGISTEAAFQAVEHGVRGILPSTAPPESIVDCLRTVAENGFWSEEPLKKKVHGVSAINLTRREGQLVEMLAHGMKNREIALSLFLSEGTVKVYLSKLFRKLGVKDRFELALHGLRNMAEGETGDRPVSNRGDFQEADTAPALTHWLRSLVLERPSTQASVRVPRYERGGLSRVSAVGL